MILFNLQTKVGKSNAKDLKILSNLMRENISHLIQVYKWKRNSTPLIKDY